MIDIYFKNEKELKDLFTILEDRGYKWNSGNPLLSETDIHSIKLFKDTVKLFKNTVRKYTSITVWSDKTITRNNSDPIGSITKNFTMNSNTIKEIIEAIKNNENCIGGI